LASKAILTLFINSIHKCIFFHIDFNEVKSSQLIELDKLHPQYPALLQTLVVHGLGTYMFSSHKHDDFLFHLFFQAHNLRAATWSGKSSIRLDDVAPSWGNLKVLNLHSNEILHTLIAALSFCKNLEQLTVDGLLYLDLHTAKDAIMLPKLTCLSSVVEHRFSHFFVCLLVPSLTVLNLLIFDNSAWTIATDLLERSSATLHVLRLRRFESRWDWEANQQHWIRALKEPCFRHLRVLEVNHPLGMDIAHLLTLPPPAVSSESGTQVGPEIGYLPHLQKLSILIHCPEDDDGILDISRMVESRMGNSDPATMRECVTRWEEQGHSPLHVSLNIPPR